MKGVVALLCLLSCTLWAGETTRLEFSKNFGVLELELPPDWKIEEITGGLEDHPSALYSMESEKTKADRFGDADKVPPIMTIYLEHPTAKDFYPHRLAHLRKSGAILHGPELGKLPSGLEYENLTYRDAMTFVSNGIADEDGIVFQYRVLNLPFRCTIAAKCYKTREAEKMLLACVQTVKITPPK